MNSRMNNTVNSQYGEKVRKLLHKILNSKLGADGKVTLLLIYDQPLTAEEICTKVGISPRHFKYVLSKKLVKEEIIKKLPYERWTLWDYEPLLSKQKYGESNIVHMIEILEDEKQEQDIRKNAESKLVKYCSSESEIVGGKTDLRPFFIRTLDNFESKKGMVFDHMHHALENYVAFQLKGEEDIQWMMKTCYPKLLSLFNKSGSIKVRHRILRILSGIYRIDKLDMKQYELTKLLRKKFFDPKEDDSIASRCSDILWDWADDELKETLKNEVFNVARSWDTFWSRADDELQDMLEDVVSDMTPSEEEILKKRGVKAMKRHYGF